VGREARRERPANEPPRVFTDRAGVLAEAASVRRGWWQAVRLLREPDALARVREATEAAARLAAAGGEAAAAAAAAEALEQAYALMWELHVAGLSPRPVAVPHALEGEPADGACGN